MTTENEKHFDLPNGLKVIVTKPSTGKNIIGFNGFTIVEDYRNPYSNTPDFMYYPTSEGVQHDADYDGESFRYCGNCKWASSLEEAINEIKEML